MLPESAFWHSSSQSCTGAFWCRTGSSFSAPDIRALAALADRLWAFHKPQPHKPIGGSSSEPQVAAVQPKKKQFKKKTGGGGGGGGGGGSGGNIDVIPHAEQA